jgi:hypothetical protein
MGMIQMAMVCPHWQHFQTLLELVSPPHYNAFLAYRRLVLILYCMLRALFVQGANLSGVE